MEILDLSIVQAAQALRERQFSAVELVDEAITNHERNGKAAHAYKLFDADGARAGAKLADQALSAEVKPLPFCGIPVSVKDLYGVQGLPTFAGTARRLPDRWSRDGWLVGALRRQGAALMGKTHTVELAYGAVGINPHHGTPRNPWDAEVHRIPGGSSCGAGVSLWEGSALLALGSDTGGSIRIPASMTGAVGHKTTHGRWPTDRVVPLSTTLDTIGGLTRSVRDSAYFFGAVDPQWGDPAALFNELASRTDGGVRVGMPDCTIWEACQDDIGSLLEQVLAHLEQAGLRRTGIDGHLLDKAQELYTYGGIAGAECRAFLEGDLKGWMAILHPTVGSRLAKAPSLDSESYRTSMMKRARLVTEAASLFDGVDVLALPAALVTPPPLADLKDLDRYIAMNVTALRPTCPVNLLDLCAVTVPVGLDAEGMPVGLQLVAPRGQDELALAAALMVEQALGPAVELLGRPRFPEWEARKSHRELST